MAMYSCKENTSELLEVESLLHNLKQGDGPVFHLPNPVTGNDWSYLRPTIGSAEMMRHCGEEKPMANLRDALSAVQHEESRHKLMLGSPSSSPLEASALASQRASFPHGDRRANNVTTESDAPESLSFSKEQLEMLQKLFGHSLPVSNPSIIGAGSVAHKGNSIFALLSQHVLSSSWIVDSDGSEHMTGNFKLLDSYCLSKESHSVRTTNGSCSKSLVQGQYISPKISA